MRGNGTWRAIALTAIGLFLGVLQTLTFTTLKRVDAELKEIKTDYRETMRRQAVADAQLAVIAVRHAGEDSAAPRKTP